MGDHRRQRGDSRNRNRSWGKDSHQGRNSQSQKPQVASTSNPGIRDDDVMNFVVETLNRRTSGNQQQSTSNNGGYQYLKADWLNDLQLDTMPEALAHRHPRNRNGKNGNRLRNRVTRPGDYQRSFQDQGPSYQANVTAEYGAPGTSASSSAGSSQWNSGWKITVSEYLTETQALEQRMAEIHRELAMLDNEDPRNGHVATQNNRDPEQEQLLRAMEHALRDRQKEIEIKEREITRRQRMLDMEIRSSKPSISERFGRLADDRRAGTMRNRGRTTGSREEFRTRIIKRRNENANSPSKRLTSLSRKRSPPNKRRRQRRSKNNESLVENKKTTTENVVEAISDAEEDEEKTTQDDDALELEEISDSDEYCDQKQESIHSDDISVEEINEADEVLEETDSDHNEETDEIDLNRSEQIKELSRAHLAAALEAEMIEIDISDEEPETVPEDEYLPEICEQVDVSDDELPAEENPIETSEANVFFNTTDISEDELELENDEQQLDDHAEEIVNTTVLEVTESLTTAVDNTTHDCSKNDAAVENKAVIIDSPASPDPEEQISFSPAASPTLVEQQEEP